MENERQHIRIIRRWTAFFVALLWLSGLTAIPLHTELSLMHEWWGGGEHFLSQWIDQVWFAIDEVTTTYPFLSYGTDWLAFAHIVIGLAFIGVWKDPVRNKWIVQWGMLACFLVFPLAFIMGPIRGIPFVWQLIDCSFGALGLIPLWMVMKRIKSLEIKQPYNPLNA